MTGIQPDSARSTASRVLSRRAVTAAAWAVPVVAVAVGAPAAAASSSDVGAFVLAGRCPVPGVLGPGFTLTAGSGELPVGTRILITGSGVRDIGLFSATPDNASITVLSSTARSAVLTSPLIAGAAVSLRTTLSSTARYSLAALVELPDDVVGTGATTSARVDQGAAFCSTS